MSKHTVSPSSDLLGFWSEDQHPHLRREHFSVPDILVRTPEMMHQKCCVKKHPKCKCTIALPLSIVVLKSSHDSGGLSNLCIGAIANFLTDERHGDNDERLQLSMKEGNVMKFGLNFKQGNAVKTRL